MSDEELLTLIYDRLYRLGMTANYSGFFHVARAVFLAYKEPRRLTCVTKWLYPLVADDYDIDWHTVERNIRYSIRVLWQKHPNRLCDLTGELLTKQPSSSELISLLVSGLRSA